MPKRRKAATEARNELNIVESQSQDSKEKEGEEMEVDNDENVEVEKDAVTDNDDGNENDEDGSEGEGGNDLEESFTAANSIPTSGHSRLQEALNSADKFIQLIAAHKSKKDDFEFEEVIPILTSEEQNAMWTRLNTFLSTACQRLPEQIDEQSEQLLQGVALVCRCTLSMEDVLADPSQSLKETIQLFSSNLEMVKTQIGDCLSKCIEAWYAASLEDRDEYAMSSLKFLLRKTLTDKSGTKSDVKRVWALHNILLSVRLEQSDLTPWLLECFGSPVYLSCPEGVKFLASLFTLSVPFLQDIHKQLKQSLVKLTSKQSYSLGEVYLKALNQSGGQFRSTLEDILQKLMDEGMLVNREKFPNLAKNIVSFLRYFHDNKQNSELKTLLSKLYAPFLWRYVKSINQNVRLTATEVFLSAYPIEDMSSSKQERESEIDKQNTLLKTLLMDEVPEVRCIVVTGLGKILANYWLLMTSNTINSFMAPIIKDLSCESVVKVRVRVYQCMKQILETSYSHVYMKEILPRLKMGLHDVNETVRIAFLDLLLAVKNIKIIKYWDICPLENLLGQLEEDKPTVSRAITQLLIPSMFPKDGSSEELLNRAIKLQQTNQNAARKFYTIAPDIMDKTPLLQLMYGILDSVRQFLKTKSANKENIGGKERKKMKKLYDKSVLNESAETMDSTSTSSLASTVLSETSASNLQNEDHLYNDINLVGGLLDCVCILWYNLNEELSQDGSKEFRLYLEKKVAKNILLFFKHYRDTSISSTIVYLASFLSNSEATHVASYSLSQLKKCDKFEIHAEALVNWRRGDEVLELLVEGIQGELMTPTPKPSGGGVHFREPDAEKPSLQKCLDIADFLFNHETTRLILLRKNCDQMLELSTTLTNVQRVIQDKVGTAEIPEKRIEDLANIFHLHLKLLVILGLHQKDLIEKFEELISWIDVQLVPIILREEEASGSSHKLAESCITKLLDILDGILQAGQADQNFLKRILDFLKQLVGDLNLAEWILGIQMGVANVCLTKRFMDIIEDDVLINFVRFLKVYAQQGAKLESAQSNAVKSKIIKFLRFYHKISKYEQMDGIILQDLVETVGLALEQAISEELESLNTAQILDRFSDIDQENPRAEVIRSSNGQNLICILKDNSAFTKILYEAMAEAIPRENKYRTLLERLCFLAGETGDNRVKCLQLIQSRWHELETEDQIDLEFKEPCRKILDLLLSV